MEYRLYQQYLSPLCQMQSTLGNSKSCYPEIFSDYLYNRNLYREDICKFYNQNFFRRVQMRSLVHGRSSHDKLVDNIKKTFGNDVTLLSGNWSATGMSNQAPTEGIGLRRFLEKRFKVITIDEYITSQRCPQNSSHRVENPMGCFTKKNKHGMQRIKNHSVLRCPNETCKSITWDRDVLGTVNMRIKTRRKDTSYEPIVFIRGFLGVIP